MIYGIEPSLLLCCHNWILSSGNRKRKTQNAKRKNAELVEKTKIQKPLKKAVLLLSLTERRSEGLRAQPNVYVGDGSLMDSLHWRCI